ncbi:type IV pilin protein [Massilia glaciei]|uniref:Prepilin-type N-terminal cleavage/methylation domain-containing protein n=2 Tax=Pseudomonadati TaxID=3379134 RepID=A0A2U2HK53_9BURK|nr:type IV pilin protein [Massilia glaciei]PWF47917.1 prepilin-type N-terminal cleavage/methylation domain-containing protein [Massilia glaciei]
MERSAGFTLVEILVTLLVVAVLAAMAYPSYVGYITKARRIEAQIALLDLMQQQERHYSQHNSYSAFSSASTSADEKRFKWYLGATPAASAYELRGRACQGAQIAHCVELQALPGTAMVNASFRDPECETLSLDSAGARRAQGKSSKCWP